MPNQVTLVNEYNYLLITTLGTTYRLFREGLSIKNEGDKISFYPSGSERAVGLGVVEIEYSEVVSPTSTSIEDLLSNKLKLNDGKNDFQYKLDIANGLIPGKSSASFLGQNIDVDTMAEETLTDMGGDYEDHFLTSPVDISISSDNAGDDQVYLVTGLQEETNGDWTNTTRLVAVSGTTPVTIGAATGDTITEMIRLHSALLVSGTSKNTGNIYFSDSTGGFTAGVPDTFTDIKMQILPEIGATRHGSVTAPSGKTFLVPISRAYLGKNKDANFLVKVRLFGSVFTIPATFQVFQNEVINLLGMPFGIPPKSDLMINVTTQNNNTEATFGFEYILEDV